MELKLNKHIKKLIGDKKCPIHDEKIKFLKETKDGDATTCTLSFCCVEFKTIIENEKDFKTAASNAVKESIQEEIKKWFK